MPVAKYFLFGGGKAHRYCLNMDPLFSYCEYFVLVYIGSSILTIFLKKLLLRLFELMSLFWFNWKIIFTSMNIFIFENFLHLLF